LSIVFICRVFLTFRLVDWPLSLFLDLVVAQFNFILVVFVLPILHDDLLLFFSHLIHVVFCVLLVGLFHS
jgi:hypothetical protein